MSLKGLIFDLDGVLTDTAKYHFLAWKRLADELKLSFTEKDNELLKGVSRIRSFEIILELNGKEKLFSEEEKEILANKKNEYYKEYVEKITKKDILPGIPKLLSEAHEEGIKCAVASISKNSARILELLGMDKEFDYIADAAKVKKPKPDPEIFLTCVSGLNVAPSECVAFEDSQAGIEAINATDMMSVGINISKTAVVPDYHVKNTSELDFKSIVAFYKKHTNY